jgi:ornithine cyclodeaminase/alanine dehydrogenase
VGAHTATTREADGATLGNACVYTEITEFALAESGDLLLAIAEGHMDTQDICGEVGELLLQAIPGRQAESAITVYISLGNVAQDLAAASFVVQHAI